MKWSLPKRRRRCILRMEFENGVCTKVIGQRPLGKD